MTSSSTYEKLDVTNGDLTDLIDDIRLIKDNEELIHIWKAVKTQWDRNLTRDINEFQIGDEVVTQFKDNLTKKGVFYDAKVIKLNTKTVKIELTGEYKGWEYNVDPRYLTKK